MFVFHSGCPAFGIGIGFNVSKQQGWRLKKMLMDGEKVVLKVQVSSRFYDSKIDILTASLPEAAVSEEEVMIIGRLCHPQPSANDNAGGSGGSDKEGSYDR